MAHLWVETFGCSVWWSFGEIFFGVSNQRPFANEAKHLGLLSSSWKRKVEELNTKVETSIPQALKWRWTFQKKLLPKQPATSNQQPATSNQQPATSKQQTANCKQQTANSKQQTANSNQQTANCKQQTANSKQGWGSSARQLSFAKRMSRRRS